MTTRTHRLLTLALLVTLASTTCALAQSRAGPAPEPRTRAQLWEDPAFRREQCRLYAGVMRSVAISRDRGFPALRVWREMRQWPQYRDADPLIQRLAADAVGSVFYCLQLGGSKPPPLGGSFSRFCVDWGT